MQESVQILFLIARACKVKTRLVVSILRDHTWSKLSCALRFNRLLFLSLQGQLPNQRMKAPYHMLDTAAL